MPFPKLAAFDAQTFANRLKEKVGPYAVFDQFVAYKKSVDGLRDATAATDVFAHDIKNDLDDSKENNGVAHASFNQRLAALEAQITNPPFPG